MKRLWILYALILISGIGMAIGALMSWLGMRTGILSLVVVMQPVQYLALSWAMIEILIRLDRNTLTSRSSDTAQVILEELPVDDPVPENVQLMAKRVLATIAKKTAKPATIQSLERSGTDYVCRVRVGPHDYNFRIAVSRAEDTSAWAEQVKNILQLMAV